MRQIMVAEKVVTVDKRQADVTEKVRHTIIRFEDADWVLKRGCRRHCKKNGSAGAS